MRHPLVLKLLRHRYILLAVLAFCVSVDILTNTLSHSLAIAPLLDKSSFAPRSEDIELSEGTPQEIGYVALLERPLFSRTRRPYEPPPPELPANEEPPASVEAALPEPQVTLQGIFIQGRIRQALVLTSESPMPVWISEGENISAWKLAEIKPNRLVLLGGEQRRIIELYVEKSKLNGN